MYSSLLVRLVGLAVAGVGHVCGQRVARLLLAVLRITVRHWKRL